MNNPYQALNDQTIVNNVRDDGPPPVVMYFKIYSGFLALLYSLCTLGGFVFAAVGNDPEVPRAFTIAMGLIFGVFCLGLTMATLLPIFVANKPWVWVYDLVIICLGLTSACFLPFCIPLLIFWLKPETKRHFGRSS